MLLVLQQPKRWCHDWISKEALFWPNTSEAIYLSTFNGIDLQWLIAVQGDVVHHPSQSRLERRRSTISSCMVHCHHVLLLMVQKSQGQQPPVGCFWNFIKRGINYSTSLNWWVYRDFWLPSTVSFDPLMTRGCLPDSPSNELVASIEGGRGKVWMLRSEFFAGSRSRCHFLFPKKNHQMLGAYHWTRFTGFKWFLGICFFEIRKMIQVEHIFFQSFCGSIQPPPSWSTVARDV